MGMGCASRAGKLDQHSVVHPRVSAKPCRNCGICIDHCPEAAIVQAEGHVVIDGAKCIGCGECLVVCKPGAIRWKWDEDSPRIQEKLAEYALTVQDRFKGKVGFVNVLIQVTKDCDCMARSQRPIVGDIGIVASADPVAADKASADLILATGGGGRLPEGLRPRLVGPAPSRREDRPRVHGIRADDPRLTLRPGLPAGGSKV